MNHKTVITTLLFGISSLAVAANSEPIKVCELLQATSLAPWGYGAHPKTDSQSHNYGKAQVDAPSDVHSDMCILRGENAEAQGATIIVVESLSDDASADDMARWIKVTAERTKEPGVTAEEMQIGEATCESGKYDLPVEGQPALQYYVACDRLVGTRHLTVNMQQREEAKLPAPPQVKELLDQAAAGLTPALKSL